MPITSATFQISENTTIKAGHESISIEDIRGRGGVYKASNGSIWTLGDAVKNDKGETKYHVTMSSRYGNIAAYEMKLGNATLTGFAEYKKHKIFKDEVFQYTSPFGAKTDGNIRFDDVFESSRKVGGTQFEAADAKTLARDLKLARKKQWIGWKAPSLSEEELGFLMDHRYHPQFEKQAREIFHPHNDPETIKKAIKSFQADYLKKTYTSSEKGRMDFMRSLVDQKLISQRDFRGLVAMGVCNDASDGKPEPESRSPQFMGLLVRARKVGTYEAKNQFTPNPTATQKDKAELRNFVRKLAADAFERPEELRNIGFEDSLPKIKETNNKAEANTKNLLDKQKELTDSKTKGALAEAVFLDIIYNLQALPQNLGDELDHALLNESGEGLCKAVRDVYVKMNNSGCILPRDEMDRVMTKSHLGRMDFETQPTKADGDCMYHAVAAQVKKEQVVGKSVSKDEQAVQQDIRNDLAKQLNEDLKKNKRFTPVVVKTDKGGFVESSSLSMKPEQYDIKEQIETASQGKSSRWGDSGMAAQLAKVYKRPVIVVGGQHNSYVYTYDKEKDHIVAEPIDQNIKKHEAMKHDPIVIVHNGHNHWESAKQKG